MDNSDMYRSPAGRRDSFGSSNGSATFCCVRQIYGICQEYCCQKIMCIAKLCGFGEDSEDSFDDLEMQDKNPAGCGFGRRRSSSIVLSQEDISFTMETAEMDQIPTPPPPPSSYKAPSAPEIWELPHTSSASPIFKMVGPNKSRCEVHPERGDNFQLGPSSNRDVVSVESEMGSQRRQSLPPRYEDLAINSTLQHQLPEPPVTVSPRRLLPDIQNIERQMPEASTSHRPRRLLPKVLPSIGVVPRIARHLPVPDVVAGLSGYPYIPPYFYRAPNNWTSSLSGSVFPPNAPELNCGAMQREGAALQQFTMLDSEFMIIERMIYYLRRWLMEYCFNHTYGVPQQPTVILDPISHHEFTMEYQQPQRNEWMTSFEMSSSDENSSDEDDYI